jgi:hypothetical protein
LLDFRWGEVVRRIDGRFRVCGQANVVQHIRIQRCGFCPSRERNVIRALAVQLVDTRPSRTRIRVVELNPNEIEPRLGQDSREVHIRNHALRRTRNVITLRRILREQHVLELIDHRRVAARLVCDLVSFTVDRRRRDDALDVEVETIHHRVTPRSWLAVVR